MKQTNQIPSNVWPLLAAPFFIALTACDRGEVAKLRAENEALKRSISVSAPPSTGSLRIRRGRRLAIYDPCPF
jgi:hypothetical protein